MDEKDNLKEFGVINRAANKFIECIYDGVDTPEWQVREIKDAFFSGALTMIDAVIASAELSEEEAETVLDLLDKEMEQFILLKTQPENNQQH